MVAGQAFDDRDEPCLHLVDEGGLVLLFAQPEEECETLLRACLDSGARRPSGELMQPSPDGVRVVVRPDARDVGDDGRRRGEGSGVGLGARLAAQDEDRSADPCRELVRQARLADAGLAHDRHQDRASGGAGKTKALAEDRLLAGSSDEWNRASGGARRDLFHRERFEIHIETLGANSTSPAIGDVRGGEELGGRAGQDLAHLRRRLQSCRRVDDRSGDQELPCGRAADRCLT